MACDLALRLMGGCPPDLAGGPVTLRLRPFRSIPGTARWATKRHQWRADNWLTYARQSDFRRLDDCVRDSQVLQSVASKGLLPRRGMPF